MVSSKCYQAYSERWVRKPWFCTVCWFQCCKYSHNDGCRNATVKSLSAEWDNMQLVAIVSQYKPVPATLESEAQLWWLKEVMNVKHLPLGLILIKSIIDVFTPPFPLVNNILGIVYSWRQGKVHLPLILSIQDSRRWELHLFCFARSHLCFLS